MDERPRRHGDQAEGHRRLALRPLHPLPAQGVRPVEDDDLEPGLGRGLEAEQHRARVGVEADTGVLEVDHEHVEAAQVLRGGLRPRAVEADHGQAARRVDAALDLLPRRREPAQAVLGAEQADDVDAGPAQDVDGVAPVRGDRHRVSEQAHAPAPQGRALVGLDPLEPHGDPRRGGERAPGRERQGGRRQEGATPHGFSSARTTASATCARVSRILLFSRVGCTRFVSRMT